MKTGYDYRFNKQTRKYDVYFIYSNGSEICCSSGWSSIAEAKYDLTRG